MTKIPKKNDYPNVLSEFFAFDDSLGADIICLE